MITNEKKPNHFFTGLLIGGIVDKLASLLLLPSQGGSNFFVLWPNPKKFFIRLRRRPRALPMDECVNRGRIFRVPKN